MFIIHGKEHLANGMMLYKYTHRHFYSGQTILPPLAQPQNELIPTTETAKHRNNNNHVQKRDTRSRQKVLYNIHCTALFISKCEVLDFPTDTSIAFEVAFCFSRFDNNKAKKRWIKSSTTQ